MLDIFMKFKKGILFVQLRGMLDHTTVSLLKKDVDSVIKNNGIKYVLFNFNNLNYIDEAGFDAINNIYKQIIINNGKLILCGLSKLFEDKQMITENLYQVCEEVSAYEVVNI